MMRVSLILAATASVSTAFNLSSKSNVATYWGQGPNQARLIETCKNPSFDIINIGFVNIFPDQGAGGYPGDNFGNACYGDVYEHNGVNTTLLKTCPYIGQDVIACQHTYGKKIFLSLGGGYPTNYYLKSDASGKSFGDFLWQAFGPVPTTTTDVPRPWGDAVVDGFDFDIESVISPAPKDSTGNTIAYQTSGYAAMINHFKNDLYPQDTSKSYYISGAPQCVLPDVHLTDVIKVAWFDFIWPQFYNTAQCSARAGINHMDGLGSNDISFSSWESSTSLNKNVKLFIGLAASTAAAIDPSYYLNVSEAQRLVNRFSGTAPFGGVMVWEATYSANNVICGLTYGDWIKRIVLGLSTTCTTSTTSSVTTTATTSKSSSTTSKTSSASTTTSSKASTTSLKTSTTSSKTTSTSTAKTTSTSVKTTSTTAKTTSTAAKTTSTTAKPTSTSSKVTTSTTSKTSSISKATTTSKPSTTTTTTKSAPGKVRSADSTSDALLGILPSTKIAISLHPTLIDTTLTILGPEKSSAPYTAGNGTVAASNAATVSNTGSAVSAEVTSSILSSSALTSSPQKSYTTFTTLCPETKNGSTYLATHTHSVRITGSAVSAGVTSSAISAGISNSAVSAGISNSAVSAGVTSSVVSNGTIAFTSSAPKSYTTFTTLCTETKNGSTYLATHTHSARVTSSAVSAGITSSAVSAGISSSAVSAGISNSAVSTVSNSAVSTGVTSSAVFNGTLAFTSSAPKSYTTFTTLCTETQNGSTYLATHTHSARVTSSAVSAAITSSAVSAGFTGSIVSGAITSSPVSNATFTLTSASQESYTTFTSLCTETTNGSTYLATHTHSAPVTASPTSASITSRTSSSYGGESYTTSVSLSTRTTSGSTYLATYTYSAPVTASATSGSATISEITQTLVTSIYTTVCPVTTTWTSGSATLTSTYSTISTATSIYTSPISPVQSTASFGHGETASYRPAPSASRTAQQETTVTDYTTSWTTVCPATSTITLNGLTSLSTYATTSTVVSVVKTTIINRPTGYATTPAASTPDSLASEASSNSGATFPSSYSTTTITAQTYAASSLPLASSPTPAKPSEHRVGPASSESSLAAPEQYSTTAEYTASATGYESPAAVSSANPSSTPAGPERYSSSVSSSSAPELYSATSASGSSTRTLLETLTVMPTPESSAVAPVSAPIVTPYPIGTNGTEGVASASLSASASVSVSATSGWSSASASSAVPYTGGAGMNAINIVGLLAGGAVVSFFM